MSKQVHQGFKGFFILAITVGCSTMQRAPSSETPNPTIANEQIGCILPDQTRSAKPVAYFDRSLAASPAVRAEWSPSNFSDPSKHDPKNYRYLVHMIDSAYSSTFSAQSSYDFITNVVSTNPCSTLSVSIINQDENGTFGNIGFILQVPEENVLFAKSNDAGTNDFDTNRDPLKFNQTMNFYLKFNGPLLSPTDIIQNTNKPPNFTKWNEVLVQGKVTSGISIIGVVIVPTQRFRNPMLLDQIRQVADEKHLPVIIIGSN